MYKINDTTVNFEFVPVTKMFEQQVKSHPDKLAVTCDGKVLTYSQLNIFANRVANSLISKGAKAETTVGVLLDRSVNVYIARQGILKSGGAFVVASPEYPEERVRYIFRGFKSKIRTDN